MPIENVGASIARPPTRRSCVLSGRRLTRQTSAGAYRMRPLSWPPLRGGSARRRWGREPCGSPEYFGSWLAKNLIGLLRPFGWFVGNGLDRSVLPCQKYDTAGKLRTAGCADGSRPIPTNIPRTPSQGKRARATNGRPYKKRRGGFHIRPCPLAAGQTSAGAYRMRPYGFRFRHRPCRFCTIQQKKSL